MSYRPTHKWTRKWSEFISTKRHLFQVGFHEVIILVYKNLDHGWSDRWLGDDLVQVHLGKFIPSLFIRKIVQMNSDQTINQSAIRSTMVQVLIDQNYNFMKTHSKKMPFCLYELGPFSSSFMLWPVCFIIYKIIDYYIDKL